MTSILTHLIAAALGALAVGLYHTAIVRGLSDSIAELQARLKSAGVRLP